MGASLKSQGYAGFHAVTGSTHSGDASTPASTSGIFMWSGSKQLHGNINDPDEGKTNYYGCGLEVVANSESYFRFRTKTGSDAGAGSELDIRTDTFFLGSADTFISGSGDGTIAITSSNFHLEVGGDITMAGTITAEAGGTIGGWDVTTSDIYSLGTGTPGGGDAENGIIISTASGSNDEAIIEVYEGTTRNAALGNYDTGKRGIFAIEGNIGGWELTATALTGGSSGTTIALTPGAGIHLGATLFADAPFSVTNQGAIKAESGTIAAFTIDDEKIIGGNLVMAASGSIGTIDFQDGITTAVSRGWRIDSTGFANFSNARIRGTLSTTVFEKETVSVVGGALMIANATTIVSGANDSAGYTDAGLTEGTHTTTFEVESAAGFQVNEWLLIKAESDSGFVEEFLKITALDTTDGAQTITATRGMTSDGSTGPAMAPFIGDGTTLTSQGFYNSSGQGTGYIFLNGTSGSTTPYIDIVERIGNNFDDLDIKVRLGDLSGINDPSVGLVNSQNTFGLYTDNVFLKGTISASAGNIGGWTIDNPIGIYKLTSGTPTSSPNGGIVISTTGSNTEGKASIKVYDGANLKVEIGEYAADTFGIKATQGEIGGWTISATALAKVDGADTIALTPGAGIHMGAVALADAPFSVTNAGELKAVSGEIAGWSIDSTTIEKNKFAIVSATNGSYLGINATAFLSTGIFIGQTAASTYKMSLKSSQGIFKWDGTKLQIQGADQTTVFQTTDVGATIAGWTIDDETISNANLVISSTGSIGTADFQSGITTAISKGWRIEQDGTANFANARIRGTLSTAVFEKEKVSAVGGAVIVANATQIRSGSTYLDDDIDGSGNQVIGVDNADSFVTGEWIICKAENGTGFVEEFMKVVSKDTTSTVTIGNGETIPAHTLTLKRGQGANGAIAPELTPGLCLVSQGFHDGTNGTGYVLINANPNDTSTPYIDIVERDNNDSAAAISIKARLGDLSGINDDINGEPVEGFGLYTDNAFLKGGIVATYGKIAQFSISDNAIQSEDGKILLDATNQIIRVGAPVTTVNGNQIAQKNIVLDAAEGNFKLRKGQGGNEVVRVQIDDDFIEFDDIQYGGIKINDGLFHVENVGGGFGQRGIGLKFKHTQMLGMAGSPSEGLQYKNVLAEFHMAIDPDGSNAADGDGISSNATIYDSLGSHAAIGVSSLVKQDPAGIENAGPLQGQAGKPSSVAFFARALNGQVTSTVNRNFSFYGDSGILINNEEIRSKADVVAFAASDKRLKKNIKAIELPIDKIKKIRGVRFKWKKNGPDWTKDKYFGNESGSLSDIGVIAQEIQEVLPEVVRERSNGYLAVDYKKIVPLLIEGIKDQQKQIEELQNRIEKLESK